MSPVVCAAPETMPSASPGCDHQRAEVGRVGDGVERQLRASSPCACAARVGRARSRSRSGASAGRRCARRRGRGRAPPPRRAPRPRRRGASASTTPRRSRMSAARSTRSSSPSGSTMCARVRPRPLDQLVLEHRRRHARAGARSRRALELRGVDARLEEAERGRDLALVARPVSSRAHRARPRRRRVGALGASSTGNGALSSSAATQRGVELVAAGEHDPARPAAGGERRARLASRMSARSPGTTTSVPVARSSRKCSALIAATRTSRTSRSSVGASRRRPGAERARRPRPTVGRASSSVLGQHVRRAGPSTRPSQLARTSARPARAARGWRSPRTASSRARSSDSRATRRVADLTRPCPAPARPRAPGSRAGWRDRRSCRSRARATPVKSVPSQTTTSQSASSAAVGVDDALARARRAAGDRRLRLVRR